MNVTFDSSHHVISIRGGGKKSVDRSNWPFVALWSLKPRLVDITRLMQHLGQKQKLLQWRKWIFGNAGSDTVKLWIGNSIISVRCQYKL